MSKQYKLRKLSAVLPVSAVQLEDAIQALNLDMLGDDEEPVNLVVSFVASEKEDEPAGFKAQYAANVWLSQEELDAALEAGEEPVILGIRNV
jgi:hypothetical protein